jgi:hypothetical protein
MVLDADNLNALTGSLQQVKLPSSPDLPIIRHKSEIVRAQERIVLHFPGHDASCVSPEDVGVAVAVEISRVLNLPAGGCEGDVVIGRSIRRSGQPTRASAWMPP